MKPVTPRHDNDCVAAVLATLFEIPIDEVPDFYTDSGTSQYERVRRWLRARGFHWYYSTFGGDDCPALATFAAAKQERGSSFPPRGFWVGQISSVDRLRDGDPNHVVVMRHRLPVFNPGGSVKEALESRWFLIGYYLLVPLDPSKFAAVGV